ncbi:hypothetical protein ASD11_01325 [Aeromicrobium sp. Root495]|uniref:hypothetical protein n=1 Tax=Aeromicrobium sp. Root495 TaxID=1736550 RepID=UPI0006F7911B|nr:hypothetical protein [Aeromicrobium sp. Root495]KQY58336.1 hypothetical protein ASD11_01325 [Aeromicrobium sp. Root495]
MSELVDPVEIERIVGVPRHASQHQARAVSSERKVYVLHSVECVQEYADLRECPYSAALGEGIREQQWPADAPTPVLIDSESGQLCPSGQWSYEDLHAGGWAYPFQEDEDSNITGLGHQDATAFASEVNRYDVEICGIDLGEDDKDAVTPDQVAHQWVLLGDDDERLQVCEPGEPGALPVTTMWGGR